MRRFQDKLRKIGHYPTVYNSTDELKLRFRDQLDKVLEEIHPRGLANDDRLEPN